MTIEALECISVESMHYTGRKSELGESLKRANVGIQAAFKISSLLHAVDHHIVHM
jgi:hypothetical protein